MGIKHFWKKATAAVAAVVIGMSLFASTSLAAKVTPQEVETTWWSYKQSSASYYTGSPIQTSANIKCPTQTCAVSRTSTATITKGYSTSASTEIKAINVGASFTITKATSAATTYSYTIKKGQAGYVVFYPKKRKSTGTSTENLE